MKIRVYILRCLSPLHVGSGDTNYGVIDNLVQREPHTHMPIIHGSSLKGALRENLENRPGKDRLSKDQIWDIFGAPIKRGEKQKETTHPGEVHFDQGMLLSLPVRSDLRPYLCATTPFLLQQMSEHIDLLKAPSAAGLKALFQPFLSYGLDNPLQQSMVVNPMLKDGPILEERDLQASYLEISTSDQMEKVIGKPLVLMPQQAFATVVEELPTVARNQLENGESKNLWYEEIVPREARFFTLISGPDALVDAFDQQVSNQVIQLGANASIGYGRTLFTPLASLVSQPKS